MVTGIERVEQAWVAIDESTTAAGLRVQFWIDEVNKTAGEGMTGPQVENLLGKMTSHKAWLDGTGHNPANPVLPVPTTETPMPGPFADGASGTPGNRNDPNAPGNTNDPNSPNFRGNR